MIFNFRYSPIGIFFLIVSSILGMKMGELEDELLGLGIFTLTVVVGLSFHVLVVLSAIYFVTTRKNPYTVNKFSNFLKHDLCLSFQFLRGLSPAILTAFGTSSR